ncbi:MAG: hypothetical protein AAF847_07440 [Bacteroidota bacterium]
MKLRNTLLFVASILSVLACSPTMLTGDKASNTILNYKIKEAFRFWDAKPTPNDYEFYENNFTYIEEGLRYNYALLKNMASVAILEQAVGEKVFLSGPHEEGLNFFSEERFGYYNPVFWEKVKAVVAYSLENDGVFKQLGKYIYDQHLKKESQLYFESYRYLQENPSMAKQVSTDYLAAMKTEQRAGEMLQDAFRTFADSKEKLGTNWYVANTAPSFWIRRQIDGTAAPIFEILELVRAAYED